MDVLWARHLLRGVETVSSQEGISILRYPELISLSLGLIIGFSLDYLNMEEPMSDDSGGAGSTGVVAILVIFVIIVVAALFVFGGRMFNGNKKVDINIQTPSK